MKKVKMIRDDFYNDSDWACNLDYLGALGDLPQCANMPSEEYGEYITEHCKQFTQVSFVATEVTVE